MGFLTAFLYLRASAHDDELDLVHPRPEGLEGFQDHVIAPVGLEAADHAHHQFIRAKAQGGFQVFDRTVVDVHAGRQHDAPLVGIGEALDIALLYRAPVEDKAVGPSEERGHGRSRVQPVPLVVGPEEERRTRPDRKETPQPAHGRG